MMKGPGLPILPKPQRISMHAGSVSRSALRSVSVGPPAPASLRKHLRDFAQRNGLTVGNRGDSSIVVEISEGGCPSQPEGYALRIGETITLKSLTAKGTFYGLQTLQQLLDAGSTIPRCTIEDWPALTLRGFYFDLTRQVPTPEYLRLIIDRLAAAKINLLMIQYREFFPYKGFPLIVSKHSYTPTEFKDFIRYAGERHIQVVPLLQSLSFQEHILRAQAYSHLREDRWDISGLCPSHPDSFRLYCALAEQLIAAHQGTKYFHLGADEANHVGQCERCKKAIERSSRAALVAGFSNKIVSFLLDRGLQPIMWADMLFGHLESSDAASRYSQDMFAELSREVIAADWDYWSTGPRTPSADRSPYHGVAGLTHLDRLLDKGYQVVGVPSCSSCVNAKRNRIDHPQAYANITAFGKELRRRGCLGMITTHWPTDAYRQIRWYDCFAVSPMKNEAVDVFYNVVRPGLEAHWHSIWRGAECAWSNTPRAKADYDRAFAKTFLGTSSTSYPEALTLSSFPVVKLDRGGQGASLQLARNLKMEKMRPAVGGMRLARRSAKRNAGAVTFSDLHLRLHLHELLWEEFQEELPHLDTPQLSTKQSRTLRKIVAEREVLEREFRDTYSTCYREVHLEAEVQLRFGEERRLQEQILCARQRE
ncbi:MAG: beta-N-acetylhexosaminidase [Armatimonadetes bacterium]|nr:beta-N-acetylhexosaminidase [Armatimonadota bacterium]